MSDKPNICSNKSVVIHRHDGEVVLEIIGDFDSVTTPAVHACCKEIHKDKGVTKILLDFKRAGRVDTSAFACMIDFMKVTVDTGTKIFVTNLHNPEESLLKLLRVEKVITVI